MLGNAAPTPYDLRFSLFGIPVRVHPLFWLFSAIMGWDPEHPNFMLLWVACVFLSILVHEFGHALTARHFGYPPEVVLYTFGGFAAFVPSWGYTTTRAVLISLAGPGAGFALFGAVWCLEELIIAAQTVPQDPQQLRYLGFLLAQLKFINLWWGLLNLLPVYPLDGGHVARDVLTCMRPRDGLETSLKLSLLVGGGIGAFFLIQHVQHGRFDAGLWPALLFAMLAVESLQHLQAGRYR